MRTILAPIPVLLFIAAVANAGAIDFSPLDDAVLRELERENCPGASVAVVLGAEIVHAKGYGVRSVETGEPVPADMLFRIGSTTKMFTAAGLVMLAEEGRLDLDAPIGEQVKSLHPAIAKLTAHQLLTHTAGLADANAMAGPHDETALKEKILAMTDRDFFEEPERIYSYSNSGYWIAGFLQQEISGKLYADHLHERVFAPLGMERTTFRPLEAVTWPFAIGHGPQGRADPEVIRPLADNAATWPAGQLFTTAPEFAHFCIAFMHSGEWEGRQVLSPFVIEKLSSAHVAVPAGDHHYGYGLNVSEESGLRWLSHGGNRTGYGSFVRICPEKEFAVVILCNKTGASLPRVADVATEIALGIKPASKPGPAPGRFRMTAEEMERCAGTYVRGDAKAALRVVDGRLVGARGGVVRKVGENRFVRAGTADAPEMEFSLVTDADGRITYLMSRGRAMKRVSPATGAKD